MFTQFTQSARLAVVQAQEEARGLGHEQIAAEHLLLGSLRAGEGELALVGLHLTIEDVRDAVAERLGAGSARRKRALGWAPEGKTVMEYALRGALELGESEIAVKHLLLALIELRSVELVLERVGASREQARRVLVALPSRDRARRGEAAPVDPRDGRSPIAVALGDDLIGDLGHPRVDARLLLAVVLRGGRVAAWLHDRGIDEAAIRDRFGELELGFD